MKWIVLIINTEFIKNNIEGIEIVKVDDVTLEQPMSTAQLFEFKSTDTNQVYYHGTIRANIYEEISKINCQIERAEVYNRNVSLAYCHQLTFELNAKILKYSGSINLNMRKARNIKYT